MTFHDYLNYQAPPGYLSDSRCLAYWIVNPESRAVLVFTPSSTNSFDRQDVITLPFGPAGAHGRVAVHNIFED